jgi:glycosyltransferase A (GT-A) superfamily protein (DUF2064 family)
VNVLPVSLLVVAKAPEPGRAKTRLAAMVGDRVAAEIRQRLESFTVIPQRGDDFADRLANAHADAGSA